MDDGARGTRERRQPVAQRHAGLPLCHCGELRDCSRRVVCHCRDCQTFQHALDSTETVFDARDDIEILMLSPVSMSFVRSREHLAAHGLYRETAALVRGLLRLIPQRAGGAPLPSPRSDCDHPTRGDRRPAARRALQGSAARDTDDPILVALAPRPRRGDHRRTLFFDADGEPLVSSRVIIDSARLSLPPFTRA